MINNNFENLYTKNMYVFSIPPNLMNFLKDLNLEDYFSRDAQHEEEYSIFKNVLEDIIREEIDLQLHGTGDEDIEYSIESRIEYIMAELIMLEHLSYEQLNYFMILINELVMHIVGKIAEQDLILKEFRLKDIRNDYIVFSFENRHL